MCKHLLERQGERIFLLWYSNKRIEMSTLFHPSMFENLTPDISNESPNLGDVRTMASIREQRAKRLDTDTKSLTSPGRYKLTENDDKLSGSNTRHLFKNLYGETPLTFLFFSDKNVENIQNVIKYIVNKETGYVVDKQSQTELLVIMRSIFLEYNSHPLLLDDKMSETKRVEILGKYKNEVVRLNDIVINSVVPKVISQLQQYVDYLRDANQQPYQMDTPKNSSIAGERQYRSITQVLIGGDL